MRACLFQPVSTVQIAAHRQLEVEEAQFTVLGTNRCVSRNGKLKENSKETRKEANTYSVSGNAKVPGGNFE